MRKELAELLTAYMGEIRERYIVRETCGEEVTAVVFDNQQDFLRALVLVSFNLGQQEVKSDLGGHLRLTLDLAKLSFDSPLRERVIAY